MNKIGATIKAMAASTPLQKPPIAVDNTLMEGENRTNQVDTPVSSLTLCWRVIEGVSGLFHV